VAYGNKEIPKQETILIKNATVWTMEAEGVLENTDVLLENGKISKIGKDLSARGARVIDGTGKHLSPGIIDEHSHIAATSINDRAANSGMVRIGDVVDSEDQGIYRALSGGVTAVQILHGSANPIGGQSALIKLRWGQAPEAMLIDGADGFIKFALGENVKRSRAENSIRYPQTRMGVEQVYVDAFQSALDYEKKHKAYEALSASAKAKAEKPRKDLALETMLEILHGERFITCHSYVQSEINMLMKVAERFNFRINTFTHILEGYKVADKMAEHGVGASTFSDWWAYKWEVRYAIPYNSTIMMREGVVTAVNSDDASLMRRLNQEAAKAVKYGSLDPVEAFKMCTVNPAKLLHLDKRMGSIKVGKDADVVLWSDNPLSIYAKAEKTIVDGTVYFDVEKDQEMKVAIRKERARLVQKMRDAKAKGGAARPARATYRHHWECDDIHVYEGN
jgi:imidazolonepropionase-like amidohydrolase